MKKVILFTLLSLILLSSCSSEGYLGCPAYSGHYKRPKHGLKAQGKYVKRGIRKHQSLTQI